MPIQYVEDFFRGLRLVVAALIAIAAVGMSLTFAYIGVKGLSVVGLEWFLLAMSFALLCLAVPAAFVYVGREARRRRE